MDSSPPGSSVHGILQARVLQWVALSFSRASSRPRDRTCSSCTGRCILCRWATWEAPCLVLGVTRDFLPLHFFPSFFLLVLLPPSCSPFLSFSPSFLFLTFLPGCLKIWKWKDFYSKILFRKLSLLNIGSLKNKHEYPPRSLLILTQHHCKMITILLNKFETRKKRNPVSNCVYNTISKGNHVTFQLKLLSGICLQCSSTSFILELPLENCPE